MNANLIGYWVLTAEGARAGLGGSGFGNVAAYERALRELRKLGAVTEVARLIGDRDDR